MGDQSRDHLTEQLKEIEESLMKAITFLKILEDDWEEEHRWIIW
jgi:hypothetical protein